MKTYEARDLTIRLGGRAILENVDFSARAGEITVIVGPNGSGKSTLVRALSGEISGSGEISINGLDVGTLKAWQLASTRAVLPQETSVAFPFTAGEVVSLGVHAGLQGASRRPAALIAAALEKVGLEGFIDRPVQTLSGGERQRVQLARVLCQIWEPVGKDGPRWLIMDEPVASLDIRHQIALMELAREYAGRGGGVIAVMHDLNLSAMYADLIVMMKDGRVRASGAPEAVMQPAVLADVFDCPLHPNTVPRDGHFVLPQSARWAGDTNTIALAAE